RRLTVLGPIKDIKSLGTEDHVVPLGEVKVLLNRGIVLPQRWSGNEIATGVAPGSDGRQRERRRVDPMRDAAAGEIQRNPRHTVRPLIYVVSVYQLAAATAEGDVDREARPSAQLCVYRPAAGKQIQRDTVSQVLASPAKRQFVDCSECTA